MGPSTVPGPAEHVNVTPAVSVLSVVVPQPEDAPMPDSGSVTFQLTRTLLVYHPFMPFVPITTGAMSGGVVSVGETTGGSRSCGGLEVTWCRVYRRHH
jgi:hypothetical protein